jgi:hypothetical protein
MGMRSDSPRVAAASEARRSSSLSSSSKRVSLEVEAAYDSPTLLPRRSLVFQPQQLGQVKADPKLEQMSQEEDFSSSKSSSGAALSFTGFLIYCMHIFTASLNTNT